MLYINLPVFHGSKRRWCKYFIVRSWRSDAGRWGHISNGQTRKWLIDRIWLCIEWTAVTHGTIIQVRGGIKWKGLVSQRINSSHEMLEMERLGLSSSKSKSLMGMWEEMCCARETSSDQKERGLRVCVLFYARIRVLIRVTPGTTEKITLQPFYFTLRLFSFTCTPVYQLAMVMN